jgi:hypothetical protein
MLESFSKMFDIEGVRRPEDKQGDVLTNELVLDTVRMANRDVIGPLIEKFVV